MSTSTKNILEHESFLRELPDELTKLELEESKDQLQNKPEVQLTANKNNTKALSVGNNYAKTIPTEIWLQILSHSKTKDLKNFRLCSRQSATLASEHFIQTFVFRATRLDIEKLEMISQEQPWTLKNVKEIRFETGFVPIRGIYRILHEEYRESSDWDAEGRYILGRKVGTEPIDISDTISEYLVWYTSWNKAAQKYDEFTKITKAFEHLKSATGIRFSNNIPQFKSEALTRAWAKGTYPKGYRGLWKTREFETAMLAAHHSKLQIRHLAHDSLPNAFFIQYFNLIEHVLKPFNDLESLELLCDGIYPPSLGSGLSKRFWTGFWKAVQLAPKLKTLRLGVLSGGYCDSNIYEYVPLRKVLGDFTWPSLTRLRLDNMTLCEKDLTSFLIRHASSLRYLTLSHIYLCRGSFQGLFQALRKGLALESFDFDGQLHSPVGLELWYFVSKDIEVEESSEDSRERLLAGAKFQFYKDKKAGDRGHWWLRMQKDGLADDLSAQLSAFVLNKDDVSNWPSENISKIAKLIGYNGRMGDLDGVTDEHIDTIWDLSLDEELLHSDAVSWAKTENELPENKHWLRCDWSWKNHWNYPSTKWALWHELEEQIGVRALYDNSFE